MIDVVGNDIAALERLNAFFASIDVEFDIETARKKVTYTVGPMKATPSQVVLDPSSTQSAQAFADVLRRWHVGGYKSKDDVRVRVRTGML